jgi:hypothetical protein
MDSNAVGKALFETKDLPGTLNWWWHSHGHGSAYFSQTDYDQIDRFSQHGWIAATVFNIFGDNHSAFAAKDPFPLMVEGMTYRPLYFASLEQSALWNGDYDARVRNFELIGRGKRQQRVPAYRNDKGEWEVNRDDIGRISRVNRLRSIANRRHHAASSRWHHDVTERVRAAAGIGDNANDPNDHAGTGLSVTDFSDRTHGTGFSADKAD